MAPYCKQKQQFCFYCQGAVCESPQINDPDDITQCCDAHALGDGSTCACVNPQIDDPDNAGACCEANALGDGTTCACVLPQIDDPDNDGACCTPDSTDNTICAVG